MRVTLDQLPTFAILSWAAMQAHELAHHVAGRVVAGHWGQMTFNEFSLARRLRHPRWAWLAVAAGPALTYALMICGASMIATSRAASVGVFLVFMNLPLARILTALAGRGDEAVLAGRLEHVSSRAAAIVCTALLAGIPMVIATSELDASQRYWAAPLLAVGPVLLDGAVKFGVLEPMLRRRVHRREWCGIPALVLWVNGAILIALPLVVLLTARAR